MNTPDSKNIRLTLLKPVEFLLTNLNLIFNYLREVIPKNEANGRI